MRVLVEVPSVERLVVMVQAEVADRICAVRARATTELTRRGSGSTGRSTGRFGVGPEMLTPQPRVKTPPWCG